MSQPVAPLEILAGEPRAYRAIRFAAVLGAAILVWLVLAGALILALEGRDYFDDPDAPGSPAAGVGNFTDARGATCPVSELSWPDLLCPESLLP